MVETAGTAEFQRLSYEAVFRIEVSLSSQLTSAIVMATTARLYCLAGSSKNMTSLHPSSGAVCVCV